MIRLACPHCGSRLNAKDELAGQTRKCPKCAQPVLIVAEVEASLNQTPAEQPGQAAAEERLTMPDVPERLNRESHYLICNRENIVASWENNGNGWMLKTGSGYVNAKRNRENLPAQGDFKFIELKFATTPDGKRLTGLASYQLTQHWALTALSQGDDQIVSKITDCGGLNREQKNAVRQALREQFMRQVWEGAAGVLEYLGSADYHSHSVG